MKIKDNREKRMQFYVDQKEYATFIKEFELSGHTSLSAFLRKKVQGNGVVMPRPKELLQALDKLGIQQSRIGANINQIAKKVHIYDKEGQFPAVVITEFNSTMGKYIKVLNMLSKAYRSLVRKFK